MLTMQDISIAKRFAGLSAWRLKRILQISTLFPFLYNHFVLI